ncbi:hypothetical protein M3649_01710 [Ureibacillus chungkukjangi]|uniref:glycosyltransferase n=1 Tax=Ureibacillus chungkukjangi TaxID=1202712 RepID=UPI00203EA66C|nr:glycosyltransferase [Ureibacillus chungkukjangi]MCM3386844.1 hypothetical protein [Ureibacillus chungkukjangi]
MKNKRLLYIAFVDLENKHYGVNNKILKQSKTFESNGYKTEIIVRNNGSIILLDTEGNETILSDKKKNFKNKKIQTVYDKQNQYKVMHKYLEENHKRYDACYFRYDLSSSSFINLLRVINAKVEKTIIEIPTFPYEEEYYASIAHKVKIFIDRLYRKKLKNYVNKIVTYYRTDSIFGIGTIETINGFDYSEVSSVSNRTLGKEINVIAVSSMRLWHGYERFIEGLYNYYQKGGNHKVILHLVGEGGELVKYKELVEKYKLQSNVIFHGILQGEELHCLFEKSDIGIDSLARHKTDISVLSSLKSREYGAKGIPFINSCKIDVIKDDFEYLLRVPENDSAINIESVIEFYNNIYSEGKEKVIKNVRSYMENKTSMEASLKPIIDYLESYK